MKQYALLLISFFIFLNTSCISQQKNDQNKNNLKNNSSLLKIELKEQTRGTNKVITFTPDSKITFLNGDITTIPLSTSEWRNITEHVNLIELSKIDSFSSPTNDRYSDKALASTITISTNEKEYISSAFDAGIPPKELESLYKVLMNKEKEQDKPQKNNIR